MLLTNFHTHCHYCDGKGAPLDMVEQAKQLNFKAIGFSSHAPLPFDNDFCMQQENLDAYVKEITALKADADIEVYLGLEVDYIRGLLSPSDTKWDALGLDYKIGSVHTLAAPDERYPMLSVDGPHDEFKTLLNEVYQGSARDMIETYFQRVGQLCGEGGFDILGHYDLVKKHNKALQFFDEDSHWYREVAISTLDDVAKSGVILEVNYGGMLRGATDDVYPSPWLLKQAKARHIPIQINADAHAPHHLGVHHQHCREILLQAGYRQQRVLLGGQWQDVAL
ncbi:histidinol-phosphatase [Photobacterium rosenbergii]|uniref:histidinol-phosphatase n=1 Tax=Photobacterium rosenbergii TaxID=294936 RepID=UPI001C990493|nr:histidinol-phosphatase [Photobacterium rosenbergii]MBY5944842.1 histidinol-phosphatase [Photobacterium rosenbergii]